MMLDRMELMILSNFLSQVEVLGEEIHEYKALISRKGIHFDKKKRRLKRQKMRANITNLVELVVQYDKILNNVHTKEYYDEFKFYIGHKIDIPPQLENQFSENDDVSYFHILKVGRDYEEHPDQVDQLKYVTLANNIHDNYYFQLYGIMRVIIYVTKNFLSIDELNIMRGNSGQLNQWLTKVKKTK